MTNNLFDGSFIPLFSRDEEAPEPGHELSEETQMELSKIIDAFFEYNEEAARKYRENLSGKNEAHGGWCATAYRNRSAVEVEMEEAGFNYHDDSWTDYELLRLERITKEEYEEGKSSANIPLASSPFTRIQDIVSDGFVWKGFVKTKLDRKWDDLVVRWYNFYALYTCDVSTVPGFFRFIYATGNDRS